MATPLNVRLMPLKSTGDEPDEGDMTVEDSGVQLWVGSVPVNNLIPMAEIAARATSKLYGSFRIRMKVTSVAGTCTGFFWYSDDTQEIDMELLSSSFNETSMPMYLVMQTPKAAEDGYDATGSSTFRIEQLPFDPGQGFHEYRFDWIENGVTFYADGKQISNMSWTYPRKPGHLAINHWTNGNGMWSKGPPKKAAVTTIEWVKAYYNSTKQDVQADYESQCAASKSSQTCAVPDWSAPNAPDVFFQNGTMCGEIPVDSGTQGTAPKSANSGSKTSYAAPRKIRPLGLKRKGVAAWLALAMTTILIARL